MKGIESARRKRVREKMKQERSTLSDIKKGLKSQGQICMQEREACILSFQDKIGNAWNQGRVCAWVIAGSYESQGSSAHKACNDFTRSYVTHLTHSEIENDKTKPYIIPAALPNGIKSNCNSKERFFLPSDSLCRPAAPAAWPSS